MPELTRKHFEEALKHARKSVDMTVSLSPTAPNLQQLAKYDQFRRKMDPTYAAQQGGSGSGVTINWPSGGGATNNGGSIFNQAGANNDDDDDLYS